MKLYYAMEDCGDGSAVVRWFKESHVDRMQALLDEEDDWYMNEGTADYITLPDDLDLSTTGIRFYFKD